MKASACQVSNGVWYNSFCCAGGWNPGVSASPVTSPPPSSSPSCTGPAAVSSPEAETEDEVRGGSRAGLTLWPPAAGAEAATRPASLKNGGEGSVETNTKEKRCLDIQHCCAISYIYFFYWSLWFQFSSPSFFTSLLDSIFVLTPALLTSFISDWGPSVGLTWASMQPR